jgi:hypothetical protein
MIVKKCEVCKKKIDDLAANPGNWGFQFPYKGGQGKTKDYCMSCIIEALAKHEEKPQVKAKIKHTGDLFVVMHQGFVHHGTYHYTHEEAANFIKFLNPKRTWKRPDEDTFKCSLSGATFRIVELNK